MLPKAKEKHVDLNLNPWEEGEVSGNQGVLTQQVGEAKTESAFFPLLSRTLIFKV